MTNKNLIIGIIVGLLLAFFVILWSQNNREPGDMIRDAADETSDALRQGADEIRDATN